MLLPRRGRARALHNAGRGDGARRCRAPAESARRGHEGRVSGESRGEGEFTHELVVALLGACASRRVATMEGKKAVLGRK